MPRPAHESPSDPDDQPVLVQVLTALQQAQSRDNVNITVNYNRPLKSPVAHQQSEREIDDGGSGSSLLALLRSKEGLGTLTATLGLLGAGVTLGSTVAQAQQKTQPITRVEPRKEPEPQFRFARVQPAPMPPLVKRQNNLLAKHLEIELRRTSDAEFAAITSKLPRPPESSTREQAIEALVGGLSPDADESALSDAGEASADAVDASGREHQPQPLELRIDLD